MTVNAAAVAEAGKLSVDSVRLPCFVECMCLQLLLPVMLTHLTIVAASSPCCFV
jgi:hypothetical protein